MITLPRLPRPIRLLVILTLCACANVVLADDFEDALAAHDRGDYSTAIKLLRPLAEQGDAAAQAGLGFMYNLGQGVGEDFEQALVWFRKAAEQGNANAQLGLGFSYQTGQGVPQNSQEAGKWYRLAAEQGITMAQYKLAMLYKNAEGVGQDSAKAFMWFSLAAKDNPEAAQQRDEIARQMSVEQLAKAKQLTESCKASVFKLCE